MPQMTALKKKGIFFIIILLLPAYILIHAGIQDRGETLNRVHRVNGKPLACSQCHGKNNIIEPPRCLKCHTHLSNRIVSRSGFHADKDEDCDACHREHQGVDAQLIDWDPADFDHHDTGFVLTGKHLKIKNCRSCHSKSRSVPRKMTASFFLKSNLCNGCHQPPHRDIDLQCMSCHDNNSWRVDGW